MANNPGSLPAAWSTEATGQDDLETIERFGIARVLTATYLVGPYRYSKLADALAEAKRQSAAT